MAFSCCRCIFRIIIALIIIVGLILAAIFIGAAVQKNKAKRQPDITPSYTSGTVCGYKSVTNSTTNVSKPVFTTYNSTAAATSDNSTVGQCGNCGGCSNFQDYQVFVNTRTSYYEDLGICGLRAAAGSSYVNSCLTSYLKTSPSCNGCLTNFVMCGFKKCGFVCVATAILKNPWVSTGVLGEGTVNDCLYCTDQYCGAGLLQCAGANQQRINVTTNVNIPKVQFCNQTQVNWTSYKFS